MQDDTCYVVVYTNNVPFSTRTIEGVGCATTDRTFALGVAARLVKCGRGSRPTFDAVRVERFEGGTKAGIEFDWQAAQAA